VPREPLEQREPQVILEQPVHRALQGLQALQEPLERLVILVLSDQQVQLVPQVAKVQQGRLAQLVPRVQLVLKDQRVLLVLQDLRDLQVQLVRQEQRVQQDLELLQAEQPIHF
jgi:hypothetical protein